MKRLIAFALFVLMLLSSFAFLGGAVQFEGDDKIVVVLDPGHGGSNVGTARNGVGEKVKTFELGLRLKELLEENGNFIVYMTRTGDYDIPLAGRGIYANTVNADLLVSLHFDGSTNTGDRGVSVITSVLPEYAMVDLANGVCSSLSAKTGLSIKGVIQRKDNAGYYWNSEKQWDCKDPSLGVLSDYYGIPTWCSKFGIKSILIEHGFFTNSGDASIIFADGMINTMAEADAEAIINYYTNHTHSYGAMTQDFPSNCMYQGKMSEKCTVCGHRRNITYLEAAPDNHYWINETSKNPSCGVDGYVKRECWITINLNEKKVPTENHEETKYIPAQPHNYALVETKEVSHAVDGYEKYSCTNCGDTYKNVIEAEGHTWTLVEEIEPKCTTAGKTTYICNACGETRADNIRALGHSIVVTEYVAESCTEDGYRKSSCTACGEKMEETIAALGHDNTVTVISEQSCTTDGEVYTVCNRCGAEDQSVVAMLGHEMLVTAKKAEKCLENGFENYACIRCGHTESKTLLAEGHVFKTEVTAEASLFARGVKLTVCEKCNERYDEVIPSTWDNPVMKLLIVILAVLLITIIFVCIKLYFGRKDEANEQEIEPDAEVEVEASEAEETLAETEETEESVATEPEEESKPEPEAEGEAEPEELNV